MGSIFNRLKAKILLSAMSVTIAMMGVVKAQNTQNSVHWKDFMRANDLVYDTLTTTWTDGLFTGNGLLGNTIYMNDPQTLRIDVGRTDVRDHREETTLGALFDKARLPIGYFTLHPKGKLRKVTARLDLWEAEGRGQMTTDKGILVWRSWTEAEKNIMVFQVMTTAGEKDFEWAFHPAVSRSPRLRFHPELRDQYSDNPPPEMYHDAGIRYCFQPLTAGGGYSTAWKVHMENNTLLPIERDALNTVQHTDSSKWQTRTYYISIGYDRQTKQASIQEALTNIKETAGNSVGLLLRAHRNWWHAYYRKSFISVPDATLNSFYWIQLYKLGSASRKGKPMIDLMGPWMASTPWPGNWWNLNTELTYSPLYAANHLGIASVLGQVIEENADNLIHNVPKAFQYNAAGLGRAGGPDMIAKLKVTGAATDKDNPPGSMELGDLTWNLYYVWLQYKYSMDTGVLERLYPILKRNINYYLHLVQKGEDGYYHLPYTYSPEYPGGMTRDANYALSLFRWGCQVLLEANKVLGKEDVLATKWKDMLSHLVPYPTDSTGLRIGKDVGFTVSHRHYSHLLMIYPLHLMSWADTANRKLITTSLKQWHSMPGALQGYSFTGGASIYALMGEGDKALGYLKTLIHDYIKANTMYMESGPVIETPLAAATSIQELLIQSWNSIVRVFPAVPDSWTNVGFDHLRTEGAFLVSAVRTGSRTRWVKIEATVDGICRIQPGLGKDTKLLLKSLSGNLKAADLKPLYRDSEKDTYQIKMHRGDIVVLYADKADLKFPLHGVQYLPGEKINYFGKKAGQR